jgi:hypothetical protein
MRFEVIAAYIMGIVLPGLEIARRRTNFDNIPGYVDDLIVGALLLYSARAVTQARPNGRILLTTSWAILVGGLYGSFFGQLQSTALHDVSGYSNSLVVVIKGILFFVSLAALTASIRSATPEAVS